MWRLGQRIGFQRTHPRNDTSPSKTIIAKAGIKKKITFHCFRHSYAVIQISLGTDIYTVSKMLTHKNVTTTQIFDDLVNSKECETANKISLK